jgi:hypothetical protein
LLTPVENGLQINHRSKKHFFDFWITYPQNTLPGYTRQEHFWGGLSSTSQIVNAENFAIRSVAQATVFHAGGQSISSGLPVTTSLHAALGIKSEWQPDKWVKRVLLDPYWLYSSTEPDLQGNAVYLNMTVDTRVLKLMVSYWNGRRFVRLNLAQYATSRCI